MAQGTAGLTILSNNFGIADGANLDAFSRLRTSEPTGLFNTQCQYGVEPLIMESGITGTSACRGMIKFKEIR